MVYYEDYDKELALKLLQSCKRIPLMELNSISECIDSFKSYNKLFFNSLISYPLQFELSISHLQKVNYMGVIICDGVFSYTEDVGATSMISFFHQINNISQIFRSLILFKICKVASRKIEKQIIEKNSLVRLHLLVKKFYNFENYLYCLLNINKLNFELQVTLPKLEITNEDILLQRRLWKLAGV